MSAPRRTWQVGAALLLLLGTANGGTIVVPKDAPTIQAAIDSAGAGDEVVVLAGVYEEALGISGKTQLTIRGKGKVRLRPGSATDGVVIQSSTSVSLLNLIVERPRTGIKASSVTELSLLSCTVSQASDTSIVVSNVQGVLAIEKCRVEGAYWSGIDVDTCDIVVVTDCDIQSRSRGLELFSVPEGTVSGNRITTTEGGASPTYGSTAGLALVGCESAAAGDLLVTDNDIIGPGIQVDVCEKIAVHANRVGAARFTGIAVVASNAVVISDNSLRDVVGSGIVLDNGTYNCTLSGNTIKAVTRLGIHVQGFSPNVCTGNKVHAAGWDGIVIEGDNGTYSSNVVTGTFRLGMHVMASAAGNTLAGNVVKGSGHHDFWNAAGDANEISESNDFGTTGP